MTKFVGIVVLTFLKFSGAAHVDEEKEELATHHTNNEKVTYQSFQFSYGGWFGKLLATKTCIQMETSTAMGLFGKVFAGAQNQALATLQSSLKEDGATVTEVVNKQCGNGWKLADLKDTTSAMAAIAKVGAKSDQGPTITQKDIPNVFKPLEFYVVGTASAGSGAGDLGATGLSGGPKSFQFTYGGILGLGKTKICIEQPDGVVLNSLKKLLNNGEDAMTALQQNLNKNSEGSVTDVEVSQCGSGWTLTDMEVKTKTQSAIAKILKGDKDLDQSQNNDPTKGLKFYVKGSEKADAKEKADAADATGEEAGSTGEEAGSTGEEAGSTGEEAGSAGGDE